MCNATFCLNLEFLAVSHKSHFTYYNNFYNKNQKINFNFVLKQKIIWKIEKTDYEHNMVLLRPDDKVQLSLAWTKLKTP